MATEIDNGDQDVVVIEDDYSPTSAKPSVTRRPSVRQTATSQVRIDDGSELMLDDLDPREAKSIARNLAKGVDPTLQNHEQGNLFSLAKRNGFFFYLFLGQCALLFLLMLLVCNRIISMPARAIPSTSTVELYHRAEVDPNLVQHFAEMVTARMEMWNFWNAVDNPKRVVAYLDPSIRTVYESKFRLHIREADRYLERQIFEPVSTKYTGLVRETIHKVFVFYQVYNGRGKDETTFQLDRISRRVKLLEIAEGAITDDNQYGLYVVKHNDVAEEQWMAALKTHAIWENPWLKALGIKQTKPKDFDK